MAGSFLHGDDLDVRLEFGATRCSTYVGKPSRSSNNYVTVFMYLNRNIVLGDITTSSCPVQTSQPNKTNKNVQAGKQCENKMAIIIKWMLQVFSVNIILKDGQLDLRVLKILIIL